jgi:uncharacterized membrane protein
MRERHKRSIVKALSWRVLATFSTMLIVFVFTKKPVLSLEIGIADFCFKLFIYYLHERVWVKVPWGKSKHPLEDLKIKSKLTSEDLDIIKRNLKDLGYMD